MSRRKRRNKGNGPRMEGFKEVSSDVYMAWPFTMQLQYCAVRDMDAAEREIVPVIADNYRKRAKLYLDELAEVDKPCQDPAGCGLGDITTLCETCLGRLVG